MDVVGPGLAVHDGRMSRHSGYWAGVATAIAVNLVTTRVGPALVLLATSIVLYGMFRWIESVRFWHPRSALRGLVISVAATAAFVLALVSLLGTWGGYLMFLVAALAAVAASTTADARAALAVLGGLALVAAGPAAIKAALQSDVGLPLQIWIVFLSLAETGGGALLVARWRKPWSLDGYRATQFTFLGVFVLVIAVASIGIRAITQPANAAAFLPLTGVCVAMTGTGLVTLFPRERRQLIRDRFRPLASEPQRRSLGETARHLLGRDYSP
jgi:hypothetical protein